MKPRDLRVKSKMPAMLERLWAEEEGQDLIEYGLLLIFVTLVAIASVGTIGNSLSKIFSNVGSILSSAAG